MPAFSLESPKPKPDQELTAVRSVVPAEALNVALEQFKSGGPNSTTSLHLLLIQHADQPHYVQARKEVLTAAWESLHGLAKISGPPKGSAGGIRAIDLQVAALLRLDDSLVDGERTLDATRRIIKDWLDSADPKQVNQARSILNKLSTRVMYEDLDCVDLEFCPAERLFQYLSRSAGGFFSNLIMRYARKKLEYPGEIDQENYAKLETFLDALEARFDDVDSTAADDALLENMIELINQVAIPEGFDFVEIQGDEQLLEGYSKHNYIIETIKYLAHSGMASAEWLLEEMDIEWDDEGLVIDAESVGYDQGKIVDLYELREDDFE